MSHGLRAALLSALTSAAPTALALIASPGPNWYVVIATFIVTYGAALMLALFHLNLTPQQEQGVIAALVPMLSSLGPALAQLVTHLQQPAPPAPIVVTPPAPPAPAPAVVTVVEPAPAPAAPTARCSLSAHPSRPAPTPAASSPAAAPIRPSRDPAMSRLGSTGSATTVPAWRCTRPRRRSPSGACGERRD